MLKIIFSYKRNKLLLQTLKELDGDIIVIDDGSEYDYRDHEQYCTYHRTEHKGKYGFWKQWQMAFQICELSTHDKFIFLPDDMYNYDLDRFQWVFDVTGDRFACNVGDVGWAKSWTAIPKHPSDIDGLFRVGWMDQGTITNRETLQALEWKVYPIAKSHFVKNGSSGIGKQISTRLYGLNIPMYLPYPPLAEFRDVESQMHKKETL